MFFTQHIPEIVQRGLWGRHFFIAYRNLSDNVSVRRRGEPQVDSSGVFGEWKDQTSFGDLRGPSGVQFTRPRRNPPMGQQIGGSR